MLKRLALVAALFGFWAAAPAGGDARVLPAYSPSTVAAQGLTLFDSESAAQQHCPRDVVVWLNLPSGIYHYKGERWYGRTKHGAFACEKEAIAAGDRASLNGQ